MADLESIFAGMSERFQAGKAEGANFSVQFDLSGDGGGQWHATIDGGKLDVEKGVVDSPDATLVMSADDFAAMSNGDLNPMMAFMSGKIKVDGDLNTVMKFQTLVGL